MTNPSKRYRTRPILSSQEIEKMLTKADKIGDEYQRLRVKAVIALAKKFGKRRAELGLLQRNDLEIKDNYLHITFSIRKKHKKGLFQYLKFVKKEVSLGKLPANYLENKQYSQLLTEWKSWTNTEQGSRIKENKRTKKLSIEDRYGKLIIDYVEYLDKAYTVSDGEAAYLFPSMVYVFGNLIKVDHTRHLSGCQLLRLIKPLAPTVWLHLFRETKGAEIAKQFGNNLAGITQVRETLDLEREETAYRYTRRYAEQEITAET